MRLLGIEFSKRSGDGLIEVVPAARPCSGPFSHDVLAIDGSPLMRVHTCEVHPGALIARLRSGIVACINDRIHLFIGEAAPDTERHDFDNIVAPLLASRDRLVLHGAVITQSGKAIAVAAPSGTGKSTLAAAAHSAGYVVLSDDCCAVLDIGGTWHVAPGAPVIAARLTTGGRDRIELEAATSPLPLVALVVAERGQGASLHRLGPADGAVAALGNSFLLDHSPESLKAWMGRAAVLSRTLPICSLTVPEGVSRIPEVFGLLDELFR